MNKYTLHLTTVLDERLRFCSQLGVKKDFEYLRRELKDLLVLVDILEEVEKIQQGKE
jgi:hypothetical protein